MIVWMCALPWLNEFCDHRILKVPAEWPGYIPREGLCLDVIFVQACVLPTSHSFSRCVAWFTVHSWWWRLQTSPEYLCAYHIIQTHRQAYVAKLMYSHRCPSQITCKCTNVIWTMILASPIISPCSPSVVISLWILIFLLPCLAAYQILGVGVHCSIRLYRSLQFSVDMTFQRQAFQYGHLISQNEKASVFEQYFAYRIEVTTPGFLCGWYAAEVVLSTVALPLTC